MVIARRLGAVSWKPNVKHRSWGVSRVLQYLAKAANGVFDGLEPNILNMMDMILLKSRRNSQ